MNDKELHQQKKQAQLDEWQAEVDKLKAKAAGARADIKIELNKQIKILEGRLEVGKSRLAELENSSEEAWDSLKEGMESAWDSIKHAFSDAASKFEK